jgi:hypothetical protein
MGKGGDNLALNRNAMRIDFPVERLAERDSVFRVVPARQGVIGVVEPKSKAVEEVETRPVGDAVSSRLIVCAKEDGSREDPLEAQHDAPIMAAVFRQSEEVQHLCGAVEADAPALLLDSECRDPDGNQPVLAERQTEFGMPRNFKKELSVAAGVCELTFRRRAKWEPTKHERTGVVCEVLVTVLPPFTD